MLTERIHASHSELPRTAVDNAERLNGLECALLATESRYRTGNLSVGGLGRFAGRPPTLEEFREVMRPRLAALPRLGLALSTSDSGEWRRTDGLDITAHVRQWVCTHRMSVNEAVEQIMSARVRTDRPLWELWLVRGYSRDEWAMVFKAHHALLDGASTVRALTGLLDSGSTRRADGVPAQRRSRSSLRNLGSLFPLAQRTFTHFEGAGERNFFWASADRDRLQRAAMRHGVTVNDVFLAALTTAIREWRYTPWEGGLPSPVWTVVPLDLPARGHLGNKAVNLRVQLPCHEPDPAARLAAIAGATRAARENAAMSAPQSTPAWLSKAALAMTFSSRHTGLIAGAIRGPDRELHFQGARLRELIPLGPLPKGQWLSAHMVNNSDRISAGFAMDPAVRNGEQLCRLWSLAAAELDEPVSPRW